MRVIQPPGARGSLKWIQRAVNDRPSLLDALILPHLGDARTIEWLSPLASDVFAEYRDAAFLERLGLQEFIPSLEGFWPKRGPQWDALARSDRGDILLVEAKAHVGELCSPPTQAGGASRTRIEAAFAATRAALGCAGKPPPAAWTETFYQLANRLAHLHFLRRHGQPAWLVLASFIGDKDMGGPATAAEWEAAYAVVHHVMGLPNRHTLSPYVLHIHPHVSELG